MPATAVQVNPGQPALWPVDDAARVGLETSEGSGDFDELVAWLETLKVTQGNRRGEDFQVLGWQRRLLRNVLKPHVMTAALSTPKKNGKTSFLSNWALSYVVPGSPMFEPRSEVVIISASMKQARIAMEAIMAAARPMLESDRHNSWRQNASANSRELLHAPSDSKVLCVALNPLTIDGRIFRLALMDEIRNWALSKSEPMRAQVESGLAAHMDAKAVALGVRGARKDWFAEWCQGQGVDYHLTYAASRDDDWDDERTWAKANPSWRHMRPLRRLVRKLAEKAREDPHALQQFRALHLNLGETEALSDTFCTAVEWERAIERGPAAAEGEMCWGFDTSESRAMTAVAAYFPQTGYLDSIAAFPENPSIVERQRRAGVGRDYEVMARQGDLITAGYEAVDYTKLIWKAYQRWGRRWPGKVIADQKNAHFLKDALRECGCSPELTQFEVRYGGYKQGNEDIRMAQKMLADGDIRPADSLLLSSSMMEIRLREHDGDVKIAKNHEAGRRSAAHDDAACAAILAAAAGARSRIPLPSKQRRLAR